MSQAAETIEHTLRALARAQRRATLREAFTWGIAGSVVGASLALVGAHLGFVRVGFAVAVLTWFAVSIVVWRWRRRLRPAHASQHTIARLGEALLPEIGTAVSSAVDLNARMHADDTSFSHGLAYRHLQITANRVSQLDFAQALQRTQRPRQKRATIVATATVTLAVALISLLGDGRERLLSFMLEPGAVRISPTPLVGDIRLVYHYPSYTGLPSRTVEGGDGSVEAVAGTSVEIAAVADFVTSGGFLRLTHTTGEKLDLPLTVEGGRVLTATVALLRDGTYQFFLTDADSRLVEDRRPHPISALLDTYAEVFLDAPATDLELHDDETIAVAWHAKDDFGVVEAHLVVEQDGVSEPTRLLLGDAGGTAPQRDGTFSLRAPQVNIQPGNAATVYVEVSDNDVVSGPKKSRSGSRRLSLFSAQRHHEALVERQKKVVESMVDLLDEELTHPGDKPGSDFAVAYAAHRAILESTDALIALLDELATALADDPLSGDDIRATFANIRANRVQARRQRATALPPSAGNKAAAATYRRLGDIQKRIITRLEKDVIYVDDVLALQRIGTLKETAKDLLAAQGQLRDLLQQYRSSHDPALRAHIEQSIHDLRARMLDLLQKMGSIKKSLPSEYRNLESGSMRRLDEQLQRLETQLQAGDLDAAARELEQLANMVENMVSSIDEAEDAYGGERYAEVRAQLAEFSASFRDLEQAQQALSERSEALADAYREKAVKRAADSLDGLVAKAREKAAQALAQLDRAGEHEHVARTLAGPLQEARQRLLDVDALLETFDFAEARSAATAAHDATGKLKDAMSARSKRGGKGPDGTLKDAIASVQKSHARAAELQGLLDKVFPDPASVMNQQQLAEMQGMAGRQARLQQQAADLGKQMEALAQELPLFGGGPRQSLGGAEQHMGQSQQSLRGRQLPDAAAHGRRAVKALGELREALEQASSKGSGGLPLPLGGGGGERGRGGRLGSGREDVQIPANDPRRASPGFRQHLLEAAKQKPPSRYEDAVRWYYDQLLR